MPGIININTIDSGFDEKEGTKLSVYLNAFEVLNREWVEKYFVIESQDEKMFKHAKRLILDRGGALVFAESETDILGCGALLKIENNGYEIAKMAVTPSAQGLGLGKEILDTLIHIATKQEASHLTILTNSKLEAAIGLYESRGFVVTHNGTHPAYERVDVVMHRTLSKE